MNRSQAIILVVITLGFILVGVLMARHSSGPAKTFTADKPFLAKGDSSRAESAPILTSRAPTGPTDADAETEEDTSGSAAAAEETEADTDSDEAGGSSPADALSVESQEALNTLDPESGIDDVLKHLADPAQVEKAAELYTTLGVLYTQTEPPDSDKAIEAFDNARQAAATPEAHQAALLKEVQFLASTGNEAAAQERLQEPTAEPTDTTVDGLRLALVDADLKASSKDTDAAAAAYRDLMATALSAQGALGDGALDVYRLASLRLVRLYRATGQKEKADALTLEAKRVLAKD